MNRTETLLKLLRLGQLQAWEIFEAMGGSIESVKDAINDAVTRELVTYKHCYGGRFYCLKQE